MLTNDQLFELSNKMNFPLEGVYFKDEIPKKLKFNTGYIINLDDSVDEMGRPNEGTHWTCLQVNQYKNGLIEPIYFDPYGVEPPEAIKKFIKDNTNKYLPYTTKDVQSLMNSACGWYCAAFLHYINSWEHRTRDLYQDVSCFLDYFDDLNKSIDFKKNEYILKMFFQSKDPKKRREIEVIKHPNSIINEDMGGGDLTKI